MLPLRGSCACSAGLRADLRAAAAPSRDGHALGMMALSIVAKANVPWQESLSQELVVEPSLHETFRCCPQGGD